MTASKVSLAGVKLRFGSSTHGKEYLTGDAQLQTLELITISGQGMFISIRRYSN